MVVVNKGCYDSSCGLGYDSSYLDFTCNCESYRVAYSKLWNDECLLHCRLQDDFVFSPFFVLFHPC